MRSPARVLALRTRRRGPACNHAGVTRRSPHSQRLCLLVGLLLSAPVLSAQGTAAEPVTYVTEGDTKASVIQRLGWPTGTAAANNREVLSYPQGQVMLVAGKVVQVIANTSTARPGSRYVPPLQMSSLGSPAPASPPNRAVQPAPTRLTLPRVVPAQQRAPAAPRPPAQSHPAPQLELRGILRAPLLFLGIVGGFAMVVGLAARFALSQRRKLGRDLDRYAPRQPAARRTSPPYYAPPRTSEPPPLPIRPVEIVRQPPSPFDGPLTFKLIDALEWRRFEELSAAYFRTQGLRAVCNELSRPDDDSLGDGGIDIRLYRASHPEPYAIVQCKAHSGPMKVESVRAFFGVMTAEHVGNGYFVSSNGFYRHASDFARANGITLITGQQLLDSLNYLPADTLAALRREVWRDDYHTPTCPRCGIKMVRRESETPFWGCSHYPACNHTIPMRASER